MTTTTKKYHLSDILSITTGKLVSTRHMDGVYDILNHMTNSTLWTHQLPSAADLCTPYLLDQHPALKEVDARECGDWKGMGKDQREAALAKWLDRQIAFYGQYLSVSPIPVDDQLPTNPMRDFPRT